MAPQQVHLQYSYILPLLRKRKKNRQYYICHTINKVNSHLRGTQQSSQPRGAQNHPPRGMHRRLGVHRNLQQGSVLVAQGR